MTHKRWTSRKFLLSLAAQLTAVAVLLWPEHESTIVEASRSITALAVLALASLGYVQAEASIDRAHDEHDRSAALSVNLNEPGNS
ncbi:MAG: hypothetical protein WD534_04880 [Phycisphaeraceae bacterium]